MRILHKKNSKIMNMFLQHIKNNKRGYFITSCILMIGIILGVMFVNHLQEEQTQEVQNYINDFIKSVKEDATVDSSKLLQSSVKNNLWLAIIMWFAGSTVIGIPIVLGIVLYRGFCLGYTISAVMAVLGGSKGVIFFITSMLLQNIIFIPCILALAVSGIKLYQSILKDKRKENIKGEVIRHTLFTLVILIFLMLASFIETYLSANLLTICIQNL